MKDRGTDGQIWGSIYFFGPGMEPRASSCWACAPPLSHTLAIRVDFYSQQYGICSHVANSRTPKPPGTGVISNMYTTKMCLLEIRSRVPASRLCATVLPSPLETLAPLQHLSTRYIYGKGCILWIHVAVCQEAADTSSDEFKS